MIRRPFFRPVAVVLASVCLINGCHQWKQEPLSATLNERQLTSARVRMVDGTQITMGQPRVVGDSLVGRVEIDSLEPGPASLSHNRVSVYRAVALASILSVESEPTRSWIVAVVMVGVPVALLVYALSKFQLDFSGLQ